MTYGILLAGGIGQRMGASVPKQFLEINSKPIILYPLITMQEHPEIDFIEIVCIAEYIPRLQEIVKNENLTKVKWIIPGGASCQDSTKNGLDHLKGIASEKDIVLIHMASYPLASADVISSCIRSAAINGNGCTARPVLYSAYYTEDRKTAIEQIDRDKLMLCTIPYAFRFGECSELYDLAYSTGKGISGNVFTNTLYCDFGKRIFFTQDSETNIKVTTPGDITLMKAVLSIQNTET